MKKFSKWYKKLNKKKKIAFVASIIIAFVLLILIGMLLFKDRKTDNNSDIVEENKEIVEEKKLKIIDSDSDTRSFAIMINNHPSARLHHAGLDDAYIIYELIVEGGMTRYLAVFKDKDTSKIGSVRSSRHYFLDYALENDAIYVHWGWSPQAQSDIGSLGINNINGLTWEGKYFYRDKSLNISSEHTGFTTMEMLNDGAKKMGYRTTTSTDTLLNYSVDEVEMNNLENAQEASSVVIKYSSSVTDKYVYDSELKTYLRYVNNKAHVDDVTKKQYSFKNIITYQVDNSTISGDNKGRQDFYNIGSGDGYYISDGYAVKIKWSKNSRSEQTKYTYLNGEEINVNDGNTFIQIQPKGQSLSIVGSEESE